VASTSAGNGRSGVLGQDLSKSGTYDSGVKGVSTNGIGVLGVGSQIAGVQGVLNGSAPGFAAGVQGIDRLTGDHGSGVIGVSNNGTGVYASTYSNSAGAIAFEVGATGGATLMYAHGATSEVTIDSAANILTSGQIYTSGSCTPGCSAPRRVREVAVMAADSTLEDTGEAHLSNGFTYVRIDPRFANASDPRRGYYVLITPEGDMRGLYVASRERAGFAVREANGGRSSIDFAYRIVAHPLGSDATRLPFVQRHARPVRNIPK
jgi:hypothetical protein